MARAAELRVRTRRILRGVVLYTALFFMALLAVPLGLCLLPIWGIWTLADKVLRRLQ